MSTPHERARRYRAKAEECRALSQLAIRAEIRDQYKHLAECYDSLAFAEDRLATDWAP
jgi:hypothetical protein